MLNVGKRKSVRRRFEKRKEKETVQKGTKNMPKRPQCIGELN